MAMMTVQEFFDEACRLSCAVKGFNHVLRMGEMPKGLSERHPIDAFNSMSFDYWNEELDRPEITISEPFVRDCFERRVTPELQRDWYGCDPHVEEIVRCLSLKGDVGLLAAWLFLLEDSAPLFIPI